MSRIGKKPVLIPNNVSVATSGRVINAKGPKGEYSVEIHPKVNFSIENNQITVSIPENADRLARALWGTMRALIFNLIQGVSEGFEKKLELNGVGFKVSISSNILNLALGFSHPVNVDIPSNITVTVDKNLITAQSYNKQQLGQFMAELFALKPHEPYKGKGFKVPGVKYRRLAGKTGKAKK